MSCWNIGSKSGKYLDKEVYSYCGFCIKKHLHAPQSITKPKSVITYQRSGEHMGSVIYAHCIGMWRKAGKKAADHGNLTVPLMEAVLSDPTPCMILGVGRGLRGELHGTNVD